jgi:GWxTD domain-containing protein
LTRRRLAAALAAGFAIAALPLPELRGQVAGDAETAPGPAPSIARVADSIAIAGDSARALALLDSAVRADRRDAAAWHQLGLLAWHMAKSKRSATYIRDQGAIRLLRQADTALRLATQLAPDSARYWLALGRFNLGSGVSFTRFAAQGQMESALEAATRAGDARAIAEAADEVGMTAWRRYEPVANRAITQDNQPVQLNTFNNWNRARARDYLDSFIHLVRPPTGLATYTEAREHFARALAADPANPRVVRHNFMALAERKEWESLRALARQRTVEFPVDHLSFLALGLAEHRLGNAREAQAAFDRALALMDEQEAARMTQLSRILRPSVPKAQRGKGGGTSDAQSFSALPEANRRAVEALYWLMADPLTLTAENEHRLEFLARVTYADLRFTVDEADLRGADTDRGDIFVRYGPPDLELTVGPTTFTQGGTQLGVTLVWAYASGLVFFFDLTPGFGTARVAMNDRDNVAQLASALPVSFENVPTTRLLDTIPVRLTRFRAPRGDSLDVLVAAAIPVDSLVRGLEVDRAPIDVDLRVYDQFVQVRGVESVQTSVAPDAVRGPIRRDWVRRVGPGLNVLRVEALQADARRGARAMARVEPDATAGFGMSDLLLGSRPTVREGVAAPARWSDVAITPSVGTVAAGSPIGIVWEMYELAQKDGASRYRVAITVERSDRGGVGGLAARVLDGVGAALTREARGRDRLTVTFDRTARGAPALVEFLSLDLATSPPGAYRLRLEITDLESRRRVARETAFRIR